MAFFGNLFGRKEPTAPSGEPWKDGTSEDEFSEDEASKDGPSVLGAALLLQFFPEDRPFLTDQELASLTTSFSTGVRKLAELWIVFYVTWLMQLLVNSKLGEDFSDDMMTAVYRRIATDEDRLPGIELIADGIKYWFKELDDGVREAITNPVKVRGEKLAAVHVLAMRFLTRDSSSPFHGDEDPQFDNVDIELAAALEEAKNISKPRIDRMIATAKTMPR
jgi:hypothetical protein